VKKFLVDNKKIFTQIFLLKFVEGFLILLSAKFLADAIIFVSQEFLAEFFLCFAGRFLLQNFTEKKFLSLSLKLQTEIRKKIHAELFQRELSSGEILTLIFDTLQVAEDFFKKVAPQIFSAIIFLPIFLVAALCTDFLTAIIFLITLPISPIILFLIGKTTSEKNSTAFNELQKLNSDFKQILSSITTLKIFRRIDFAAKKLKITSQKSSAATLEVLKFAFISSFALELLTTLSIAIVAVTLGLRLVAGNVEFFAALFLLILAPEFFLPLRKLGIAFHIAISAKNSVEKVKKFFNNNSSLLTPHSSLLKLPPEILVENLSFTYPQKKSPALREINLKIPAGKITAIVGESGAGKSTLLKILAGIYLPSEGEIFFSGLPTSKMQRESFWQKISYVPQAPKLFSADLQKNFSMFGQLDTRNLQKFLQEFNLKTNLSEKKLSRGQIQRLGIIRAFLKNTSIIILDEPTAGLDIETEKLFLKFLQKNSVRKTIIIATHRQAVINFADFVINLEVSV